MQANVKDWKPGCPLCGADVRDARTFGGAECDNGCRLQVVYDLEADTDPDGVCCYFCMDDHPQPEYHRGEAFLASAAHTPWDGNANYVCTDHLDRDAVVQRGGVFGHIVRDGP
jgi:hypothetical protein